MSTRNKPSNSLIPAKKLYAAYKKHGSLKRAWKAQFKDLRWERVHLSYHKAVAEGVMPVLRVGAKTSAQLRDPAKVLEAPKGAVKAIETKELNVPKRGVKRYLFTSAQNNTEVFMPFWDNLMVLAEHYKAKVHVSRYVYLTHSHASLHDKFRAFERIAGIEREKEEIYWEPVLDPYLSDERIEVAPGLVWCGEMNILPTATNPLSGLEVYTGRKSAIFPHAKLAMQSIASAKHAPVKFNYTTGTVTLRNYIQRKAGLKAEFHHCYGAILVEVDSDGDWFVRQINADSEGTVYDFDVRVSNKVLTTGNRIEAISWGDVHVAQMETWVKELSWGEGGILDTLKPRYQFLHDVLDFRARSHHEIKKPHRIFLRHINGETDVKAECMAATTFLGYAIRPWCMTLVVDSNHHDHLGRWLEESDGRYDPKNVEFWTDMQRAVYKTIREGHANPDYFSLAVAHCNPEIHDDETLKFLERDESFIVCPDRNGGIECGAHGHYGPNGSRGSGQNYSRMGRKANLGHYHSAAIIDGIYQAGACSKIDADWKTGPSSHSHSDIITYANGKRAIITKWNNKWRANG